MHKSDNFQMPEDRRWLEHGETAVLSRTANSGEGNSLWKQLQASGFFLAGLACVVDALTSFCLWSGLCCRVQPTPSQEITMQDG